MARSERVPPEAEVLEEIPMPPFTFMDGLRKTAAPRASVCDYYAGKSRDIHYGTSGIRFADGSVAIQTYAASPFTVHHEFAGQWYDLGMVRADDPEMRKLEGKIHRAGLSPHQQANNDRIEKKRANLQAQLNAPSVMATKAAAERAKAAREQKARDRQWFAEHYGRSK